jgi:hypothetical protein
MRYSIGSLTLAVVSSGLLVLSPVDARSASATFDLDLEGWEAVGIKVVAIPFSATLMLNTGDMVHEAADGNPGGYARLTDAIETPASFAAAPVSFLNGGNLTPFVGGTLSFDHKLFATGTPNEGIAPYSVIFISGNPTALDALVWVAPAPGGATPDWVHFDIPLNESALTPISNINLSSIDPSLPSVVPCNFGLCGTKDFDDIMGDVDELLVAFELVNNDGNQRQEHGGIDNVVLVPEPDISRLRAVSLLILFGGSMIRRRVWRLVPAGRSVAQMSK